MLAWHFFWARGYYPIFLLPVKPVGELNRMIKYAFAIFAIIFFVNATFAKAGEKVFSEFAVTLPEGWSGEERKDFLGKKGNEYMLVLGVLDEGQEKFLAQTSIYFLPNINKENARDFAAKMAEAQGGSSELSKDGNFWTFTGEPRTQTVTGRAKTMVAADLENLLIIISQDPENLGADKVVQSLRGMTDAVRKLLGR